MTVYHELGNRQVYMRLTPPSFWPRECSSVNDMLHVYMSYYNHPLGNSISSHYKYLLFFLFSFFFFLPMRTGQNWAGGRAGCKRKDVKWEEGDRKSLWVIFES